MTLSGISNRVENPLPKFFSSGSYADFLNHFNEPNTIQTPPGFTDGLPVIVARSKGGHSNLSVSALSSTISSKETLLKSEIRLRRTSEGEILRGFAPNPHADL